MARHAEALVPLPPDGNACGAACHGSGSASVAADLRGGAAGAAVATALLHALLVLLSLSYAVERVFLRLIAKDILLKVCNFLLYLPLLLGHGRVGLAIFSQRTAKHVGGLVNLALVLVRSEIIVNAHRGGIINVAGHDYLLREERCNIAIADPEQRILGLGSATIIVKVVLTVHDWAKGDNLAVEGGRALVVVVALLQIVALDLTGWYVAVVNTHLPSVTLIVDVVVIEELQRLDARTVSEVLIAVKTIFIGMHPSAHDELEDVCEEIHLTAYRLYGIVESGIGIIGKVELTIDVAAPYHIGRHLLGYRKFNLLAYCHVVGITLWLLLLGTSPSRLCRNRKCKKCQPYYKKDLFHYLVLLLSLNSVTSIIALLWVGGKAYLTIISIAPGSRLVRLSGPTALILVI